jgi:hypothetical protein
MNKTSGGKNVGQERGAKSWGGNNNIKNIIYIINKKTMQHIIVHGKDGEQLRFELAGRLLKQIIPDSTLIEGSS